ncbi:SusC/RagA family TonB-linked outer membrane protein [Pedobacter nyackensis]|uniref:SusC/RagA family TonB-linked outer membrane protein n=1 Tax=Pedobacter nyackensis TaxID=475255 RepID=UPI0029308BD0|nr:SusC/RagA family TonB-linked outer membrane protein [Pedobacter nyackensis]
MRLTTVILIATLMQVNASGFGQKITYVKKNKSLLDLFQAIRKQTGHKIFWAESSINVAEIISANFRKVPLEEVLNKALSGLPVTYAFVDGDIAIKKNEPSFRDQVVGFFTAIDVRGRVLDDNNAPLVGAIVKVKGTTRTVITDSKGEFLFRGIDEKAVLTISFLGYETQEVSASKDVGVIKMVLSNDDLDEVEIVSTGYQEIPKERATGSYTTIDNKLLNRTVSTDLLTRLKGVTNGLLTEGNVTIRGRSTIFSDVAPLIVVDNFPFDGDINTINPETVENITILKDAAAASIWGVRAGNGVIVITTKKGVLNHIPRVSLKADLTIGDKPDLYYEPQLTSSEFIDVEQFLFDSGAYTGIIDDGYSVISPVVATLQKIELDPSYSAKGKLEIDALRNIDYRKQQNQYLYRNSSVQRYYVDLSGGGTNQTYYFSGGYDKNLPNSVALSDSRISLKGSNSYSLLNNRLKLNTDITFSKSKLNTINLVSAKFLPYEQWSDDQGNASAVLVSGGLRDSYTDAAESAKLLDWKYRPLDELRNKYSTSNRNLTDYRINLGLDLKIIDPLSFSLNYQYYNSNSKTDNLNSLESFSTRDVINRVTEINQASGVITRPIPLGDIYNPTFQSSQQNIGRGQFNFNRIFSKKHEISAIAGFEIRENGVKNNSYYLYGYKPEIETNIPIDPVNLYKNYVTGGLGRIGQVPFQSSIKDRYVSWYGNTSYTYKDTYTIYGSYRKDKSNLFGVKANQKGVPLWSAGIAWNIHKEDFYDVKWLSSVQFKASFGYNGNVNNSLSAYLTATPASAGSTNIYLNSLYYDILNPPNDNLRWERVKNINLGLYFSLKNNIISGSLEYYIKDGIDLIANSPLAPQTGVSQFTGNTANTHAKGIDLQINSRNLNGTVQWRTTYILNYNKDKITEYKVNVGTNSNVVSPITLSPLIGFPINSMFAYKWAGLDGSGNPQGYLDGNISLDYTKITNSNDRNQLDFFGSRTPRIYGSLRNTFSYKKLELSFNISYKFNYYFRRLSLNNSTIYNASAVNFLQTDYRNRWQKPGDESSTSVPSLVYPANSIRTNFYTNSAVLIERGDHIRLQDVQMNYSFTKKQNHNLPFGDVNIYMYASNFGVLWKANAHDLDPDVKAGYPTPLTIALGAKVNF